MEHHFNTQIAEMYGIEEAIILHHFYFWIAKNAANEKHFHDGLFWTYNSKKAYADFFTYMNETKIFRVIKNLEDNGIIKKGNYNKDKWNKTNWYAITKKGLDLLKECGYEMRPFSRLMQNDIFDCAKMNDGACQNEQSNNTDNNNTDNNKEKVIDESITKKTAKSNILGLDMSFVDDSFMPILIEWLEYKKEKKQSYKQRGFLMLYKKLLEMSGGNADVARKIVEQSMQNNYAGLFPLRQASDYSQGALPTGMIITDNEEERNKKYEQSMRDLWK